MNEDHSWEAFFSQHASIYDSNGFTFNTVKEVDFIIDELHLRSGAAVLDVGCGTGRHSINLAQRGYQVTGIDLSVEMLSKAAQKAIIAGVKVAWIQADATRFYLDQTFDGAICLCEGAFGLLGSGDDAIEHPLAILQNISRCLKPGAKFVLTALNGLRMIRRYSQTDVEQGSFDPLTLTQYGEYSPLEKSPAIRVRERAFIPTELVLLMQRVGMHVLHMWGGTAGNWNRKQINLDEVEIMIVAVKTD
ncbi:MAG: class I SAM-dependent methyltransferase [Anaerolineae bacterium]